MYSCRHNTDVKGSSTQSAAQIFGTIISDTTICPKTFSAASNESAESWLKLFERYADYRNLRDDDKKRLFIILLIRGLSTRQDVEENSYDQLIEIFKKAFLPSPELKWTEASALWT